MKHHTIADSFKRGFDQGIRDSVSGDPVMLAIGVIAWLFLFGVFFASCLWLVRKMLGR
jgi:DMSO/TMAO reductase YedYZ heme-binding membrane subunit